MTAWGLCWPHRAVVVDREIRRWHLHPQGGCAGGALGFGRRIPKSEACRVCPALDTPVAVFLTQPLELHRTPYIYYPTPPTCMAEIMAVAISASRPTKIQKYKTGKHHALFGLHQQRFFQLQNNLNHV